MTLLTHNHTYTLDMCYISQVSLMAVLHTHSSMHLKIVQHERMNVAKLGHCMKVKADYLEL